MRPLPLLFGGGLLLALACSGEERTAEPEPVPAPATPPPAPTPSKDETIEWPLLRYGTVPAARSVALPGDLLDVALTPDGSRAWVVTGTLTDSRLWTWDFGGSLTPVEKGGVLEVEVSPFDGSVYLLTHADGRWFVERGQPGPSWTAASTTYSSEKALSSLVTALTRYDGGERLFFAREYVTGKTQVLGVKRSGARPYEVTSPDGALGELTAEQLRNRDPEKDWAQKPAVMAAESAAPLSVHPYHGTLLWADGAGHTHARAWADPGNWGNDAEVSVEHRAWSPNGWYQLAWKPGQAGATLVGPDGETVAIDGPVFSRAPDLAENGRTLVGAAGGQLVTVAVNAPLAPVRYLDALEPAPTRRDALARQGIVVTDTDDTQLYQSYDEILYDWPEIPTYAAIDGMLEVLHAGFQAVFVRVEADVSRPRFATFLDRLAKSDEPRIREIGSVARRMLDGDYDHPEGARALAEVSAVSELHHKEVDFGDFHPRGPYATSEALSNYFRAFKYIDALELSDVERRSLQADTALVDAWKAWISAQADYLSGTRYQGALADFPMASPYVLAECLPKKVTEHPYRFYPLSWGIDSEILDRTVAHDELGPTCTVPQRGIPSGLDLMAGFGSPTARELLAPDVGRYPALGPAHDALRARFPGPIAGERFVEQWMRLLQILGNDEAVPEGVSADAWRRRLLETALASWASFRHTTVLVNEGSAAQMGDGGDAPFETLTIEPIRGAVDPLPDAWTQLAGLLGKLEGAAKGSPTNDRLADVLGDARKNVERLAGLSGRQTKGEPLTEEEYRFIQSYAGTVEHPYLLLTAAAAQDGRDLSEPDPMMRIVDVHTWNDPLGPPQYLHVAVGRPRAVVALVPDRNLLLPGSGAWYSYYERVADHRLDDAAWRTEVDTAERPGWVNPSLR